MPSAASVCIPLIPANAAIQDHALLLGPRFRGDERMIPASSAVRTHLAARSAAIMRTSRGCTSGLRASRVQAASKYGHVFSPHSVPTGRMSARSPLAPTIGALAPTCGDKLGKATNKDAAIAEMATA